MMPPFSDAIVGCNTESYSTACLRVYQKQRKALLLGFAAKNRVFLFLSNNYVAAPKAFCHSPAAMKRIKISLALEPIKQRIHFAPATKYFADKKKKQNKNACR